MKLKVDFNYQIGFMLWFSTYKGERNLGISLPCMDIYAVWVAKKYRKIK